MPMKAHGYLGRWRWRGQCEQSWVSSSEMPEKSLRLLGTSKMYPDIWPLENEVN